MHTHVPNSQTDLDSILLQEMKASYCRYRDDYVPQSINNPISSLWHARLVKINISNVILSAGLNQDLDLIYFTKYLVNINIIASDTFMQCK